MACVVATAAIKVVLQENLIENARLRGN